VFASCLPLKYGLQTGVFCETVAALLIESYKVLKSDPSDLLGSQMDLPVLDTSLTHSNFDIMSHVLWFLSLCVSLSCDLSATLAQTRVRRYLKFTRHSETLTYRVSPSCYSRRSRAGCPTVISLRFLHRPHRSPRKFQQRPFQTSEPRFCGT
jgi:Family of unknown function (DUF6535)